MTDVTPLVRAGAQIIQGYGARHVRVNGIDWPWPVMITPEVTTALTGDLTGLSAQLGVWAGANAGGLVLLAVDGDIAEAIFSNEVKELRKGIRNLGLALEVMNPGPVARTYNVLLTEGRQVIAVFY